MVRNFKIKRTPPRVWIGVIIVIFAFILVAWSTDSYYGLIPIIFPILLLIDELLAKVQVQENGDIWLKRGFSGSVKAYGVIRVARRKKAFFRGRIVVYYTKGFISFDLADEEGFLCYAKELNPRAIFVDEN